MLHRRCLIHSKLQLKETGSKKKQVVVALSGIPSPGDGSYQAIPAQVQVFKDNYDPSARTKKNFQNPKLNIGLESAEINVIGSISQQNEGRRLSKGSKGNCRFTITTNEGSCYELIADNESERLVWVTVLEFLSMFPFSSVPEVPKCNPVFRTDLDPNLYNADSVWPVYILPEEVGSRCSIIGSNVLALQRRIQGVGGVSQGRLQIYSLTDCTDPIVSWDHDKIRRTGKLGRLLFIEIGRRCRGGPGLVWMYIGGNDKRVFELRDHLRRFLFEEPRNPLQSPMTPPTISPGSQSKSLSQVTASCSIADTPLPPLPTSPPPLPPLRCSTATITTSSPKHNTLAAAMSASSTVSSSSSSSSATAAAAAAGAAVHMLENIPRHNYNVLEPMPS